MSNQLFGTYREALLDQTAFNWGTGIARAAAITSAVTQTEVDEAVNMDELTAKVANLRSIRISGMIVGPTGEALSGNIVFEGLFVSLALGVIIYEEGDGADVDDNNPDADATARVLAYIDAGTGIPFVPAGGTTTIQPSGSTHFFRV